MTYRTGFVALFSLVACAFFFAPDVLAQSSVTLNNPSGILVYTSLNNGGDPSTINGGYTLESAKAQCTQEGGTVANVQTGSDSIGQYTTFQCQGLQPGAQTSAPSTASSLSQASAPTGSSDTFIPIAPIPGLTQGVAENSAGIAAFLNNLYKYLIGLAAVLAVIEIIRGGLEISTAADNASRQSSGRRRILQAIFGLVLVLLPVLVFSIINPRILNLKVNIPPLDTQSGSFTTQTTGCTNNNCLGSDTSTTGSVTTGGQLYPCSGSDCSAALKACAANAPPGSAPNDPVVCVRSDGSVDPRGRTDSIFLPTIFSSYGCIQGETLNVSCTYTM